MTSDAVARHSRAVYARLWLFALLLALTAFLDAGAAGEPSPSHFLTSGRKLYSQLREEVMIRDFFQDRRDGVFVDIGCALPIRYSTTYFLEKHLGWSGIGVDAVASYGEAWAKKRPRSKFLNRLVTDHSGTMEKFYEADYRPVSSAKKNMVEGKGHKEIEVRSSTLNDLLSENGIEKIDFLSMDIEGAQLAALRGFDIQKYSPDLVCIERYKPDNDAIIAYFEDRGYELLERYREHDIVNFYFAPRERPARSSWEPPARDPTTPMNKDGLPRGSYRESCRDCRWDGDTLACDCRLASGDLAPTRAEHACGHGYANLDGALRCENPE